MNSKIPSTQQLPAALAFSRKLRLAHKGSEKWALLEPLQSAAKISPRLPLETSASNCGIIRPPFSAEVFQTLVRNGNPNIIRPPRLLDGVAASQFDAGSTTSFESYAGCVATIVHDSCDVPQSAIKVSMGWRPMGEATATSHLGNAMYSISAVFLIEDPATDEILAGTRVPLLSDNRWFSGTATQYVEDSFRSTDLYIPWHAYAPGKAFRLYYFLETISNTSGYLSSTSADIVAPLFYVLHCCEPPYIPS